jgi:hypothetical protein
MSKVVKLKPEPEESPPPQASELEPFELSLVSDAAKWARRCGYLGYPDSETVVEVAKHVRNGDYQWAARERDDIFRRFVALVAGWVVTISAALFAGLVFAFWAAVFSMLAVAFLD